MNRTGIAADAAIGVPAGVLLGLFFVFRTLFTDGPSSIWHLEYLFAHALTLIAYAVTTLLALWWRPRPWWGPGTWMLAPALLICILYTEPALLLRLAVLAAASTGAAAGITAAAWRDEQRRFRAA